MTFDPSRSISVTVRAEIFAVVLFSRISRVKPSRKFPLQFMSIYSNDNISKIAKLTTRELPHLAKTVKITVRENNGVYSYIRWSKWMISSKLYVLYDYPTTTTKFGNKTRSLRTKQNWMQTWQLAHVLLLTTAYSAYACVSFWVSFLIWNWCYCCCRLYFIYWAVIFLWLRHFGCYL